jgi:NADH pyrophosphatase NudC (nudix superfamily)
LGESQYVFSRSGERIVKHVDYYLLKYKAGEEQAQEVEVMEVKWFDPAEAMKLLSFKKDQDFLQQALKTFHE